MSRRVRTIGRSICCGIGCARSPLTRRSPSAGSLVPVELNFLRLLLALLLSISFLVLIQAAQPFKRLSTTFFSVCANLALCFTLLAAMLVKLVKDLDQDAELWSHEAMDRLYFGFESAFPLTVIILLFNFGLILDFCILIVLQARRPHVPALVREATAARTCLVWRRTHSYLHAHPAGLRRRTRPRDSAERHQLHHGWLSA